MTEELKNGIEKLKVSSVPLMRNHIDRGHRAENNKANIAYLEAITTIGGMVIEARAKKDSEKLRQMAKAIQDIAFYVNDLQLERENLYLNLPINLN